VTLTLKPQNYEIECFIMHNHGGGSRWRGDKTDSRA